jgi:hypothetical protein
MKSLVEHPATFLEWHRIGASPFEFELYGADGVFATFTFLEGDPTLARVCTAEGVWTIKHLGILNPVVTLRVEGGTTNMATFRPHAFRHGRLEFLDGAVFEWKWFHEVEPSAAFLDPGGKPQLSLFAYPGKPLDPAGELEQCDVVLDPALSTRVRSALLAAFGWYLICFDHMKESDAVAAETSLRL